MHSAAQAVNAFIYPNLPYDTLKDFVQVAPIAGQPNVLVVAPSSGYKTVADLIADAKKKPGALNFGSAGIGSGTHINAEKFKLAPGIDVTHIPYKGTPEALTDTMAGRVTYFFSPISAALPLRARRQARRARRQLGEALERVAERADDRRERACRASTTPLGRPVRAGRHAARRRRQDQPRRQPRACASRTSRSAWRRSAPKRCR